MGTCVTERDSGSHHGGGGQDISTVAGQLLPFCFNFDSREVNVPHRMFQLLLMLKSYTDLKSVEMFSSSCVIYWLLFHLSP